MFLTFSKGGIGTWVLVIEGVFKLLGIETPEGSVLEALNGAVSVVALLLLVWSTLSRKDLFAGLIRK